MTTHAPASAPDRIELPGGFHLEHRPDGTYALFGRGSTWQIGCVGLEAVREFAAAMTPAASAVLPSDADDEALAAILVEEFISFRHNVPAEDIAQHIVPFIARHRAQGAQAVCTHVRAEWPKDQPYRSGYCLDCGKDLPNPSQAATGPTTPASSAVECAQEILRLHAYDFDGAMQEPIAALIQAHTDAAVAVAVKDYEEALADKRRLAREIDVALHGEEGAAKQASLCDLVGPVAKMRTAISEAQAEIERLREALTTCVTSMDGMDYEKDKDLEAFAKYHSCAHNKAKRALATVQGGARQWGCGRMKYRAAPSIVCLTPRWLAELKQLQASVDGKTWFPARSMGLDTLTNRIRCAWMVFTGQADALVWPPHNLPQGAEPALKRATPQLQGEAKL